MFFVLISSRKGEKNQIMRTKLILLVSEYSLDVGLL